MCHETTYLNSGFAETDPFGQIFTYESVGIVGPLKDFLQGRQLSAGERGPIATRFLAAAGRDVRAMLWRRRSRRCR